MLPSFFSNLQQVAGWVPLIKQWLLNHPEYKWHKIGVKPRSQHITIHQWLLFTILVFRWNRKNRICCFFFWNTLYIDPVAGIYTMWGTNWDTGKTNGWLREKWCTAVIYNLGYQSVEWKYLLDKTLSPASELESIRWHWSADTWQSQRHSGEA